MRRIEDDRVVTFQQGKSLVSHCYLGETMHFFCAQRCAQYFITEPIRGAANPSHWPQLQ